MFTFIDRHLISLIKDTDRTTAIYDSSVDGVTIHSGPSSGLCFQPFTFSLFTLCAHEVQGNLCTALSLECVGLCQGGISIGTYVTPTFTTHSSSVSTKICSQTKKVFFD